MHEQTPTQLSAEQAEHSSFKELLEQVSSTDIVVYELLNYTNKSAKDGFINDPSLERPNFEYDIDTDKIDSNIATLLTVYQKLDEDDLPASDVLTLRVLADDASKKNAFVKDCIDYNAATSPEEKARIAEIHSTTNEAYYGKPEEDVFYSLLSEEIAKIPVDSLSEEDKKMYDELLAEIGDIKPVEATRFKPQQTTVERFSEMIGALFENFFSHLPEGKEEFTTTEACDIANEIIASEIGEDATSYRAVMDEKATNCSVDHQRRILKFPVERAAGNFSRLQLKQILVHELGTHAYRAMVYEEHDIPALSHELPGNEAIDEGIAKCCEQAVAGKYQDSGVEHYINIGLANFKGKSFREVFEIQRRLLYLQKCNNPDETPEEKTKRFSSKDNLIFNRTARCFRGTGVLPNNKDLVYYNGASKVWQYIEEHIDDPELLDHLFLSGKSDILNKGQERLVYETKW